MTRQPPATRGRTARNWCLVTRFSNGAGGSQTDCSTRQVSATFTPAANGWPSPRRVPLPIRASPCRKSHARPRWRAQGRVKLGHPRAAALGIGNSTVVNELYYGLALVNTQFRGANLDLMKVGGFGGAAAQRNRQLQNAYNRLGRDLSLLAQAASGQRKTKSR